jgi:hypothetical protein
VPAGRRRLNGWRPTEQEDSRPAPSFGPEEEGRSVKAHRAGFAVPLTRAAGRRGPGTDGGHEAARRRRGQPMQTVMVAPPIPKVA